MLNINISFGASKILSFKLDNAERSGVDNKKMNTKNTMDLNLNDLGLIESKTDKLIDTIEPSNHKALLDIAVGIYHSEVSRYRFLEDKSSRLLVLVTFLLPTTITTLYWLFTKHSNVFNVYVFLAIIAPIFNITACLIFILKSYSITYKPTLDITDKDITDAGLQPFAFFCALQVVECRASYQKYQLANQKKGEIVRKAHKNLIYYFVGIAAVLIFMLLSFADANLVSLG